jgi:hypothetical protein
MSLGRSSQHELQGLEGIFKTCMDRALERLTGQSLMGAQPQAVGSMSNQSLVAQNAIAQAEAKSLQQQRLLQQQASNAQHIPSALQQDALSSGGIQMSKG